MMPVMKPVQLIGVFHSLDAGSQRYVDAVLGTEDMTKFEWRFVASSKGTTGEYVIKPRSRRDANMATTEAGQSSALAAYM
jgi:hypothetical protein